MERRKGKDQNPRNISKYGGVEPDDGFVPQFSEVLFSQCVKCKKNQGGSKCSYYGTKPRRYQLHSCKLRCPQRSV